MAKKRIALYLLRALLIALCVCSAGFIFYNSIQTGEESSSQSKEAVEIVQEVVGAVAPESPIATATGEDFNRLHITVRTLAHFAEFVLLGLFATWSCLSFSPKKGWLAAPVCFTVATAVFDECLQKFTFGRASELLDVLADGLGGLTGFAFALLSVWLVGKLLPKNKKEGIKTPVWEANIYIKRY